MLLKKLGVFLFLLFGGIMSITANAQQNQIWNPMFDEIRMTRKPNNETVYQDIMSFKFGNTWAPWPFKVNLDNATIALFPKIKGPNDPTGTLEWDQNWKGEIWTADRSVPEVNANLIFTFDKSTEAIIIPRDKIYDNTQLIVRLKGLLPDGSEILYDQFFMTLSTEPGETGGEVGGGETPPDPTIVIQIPCYVSSLAPYSTLVDSSGGIVDLLVNTSLDTCSWIPSTTSDFIVVPEDSYTGSETISITVMENTTTEPRVGSVVIDGYEFTIFQKGVPIEIPEIPDYGYSTTINPANIIVGTNESTGSFEVVIGKEDAEWNVVSDDFLVVEGPTTRTGNSTINYRVLENTSQEGRVGSISAAGGNFFVYQRGVEAPVVEQAKLITNFVPEYGAYQNGYENGSPSYSFQVITNDQSCSWEASIVTSNFEQNGIQITNGSGVGNGVVSFTLTRNRNSSSPRFAEIKVTTSDGHYRIFPLVQEAAYRSDVTEWAKRYAAIPFTGDFSVVVGNYTLANSDGENVKISFKESVKDVPWQLWISPPIDPNNTAVNQMITSGVGDSWDNVSFEDALSLNIPKNTSVLNGVPQPKIYKVFLNFTPQTGVSVYSKPYYIIQRAQPEIITETVIQEVEVPSKFIKSVIPPFTVVQGSGGSFTFNVEPSVEDCSWKANVDAEWVGLVSPMPAGVPVPPINQLPKTQQFVGQSPLSFMVGENNTSDVRITLISMSVWPQGFMGTFEDSGAFVNGYHTIIQVPKPGAIRLIIDGKVDVIPTSNIPFNVNVSYQDSSSQPTP